jgi:protein-S-isoprenylcysteine O-methyltransferase Ste14
VGAALLSLLFQGSTRFTEELTLAKYPAYADYQRTTSRLLPWPRTRAG